VELGNWSRCRLSVRLFIAMAALHQWPLYQLDVKNDFLNGDLQEEIYME